MSLRERPRCLGEVAEPVDATHLMPSLDTAIEAVATLNPGISALPPNGDLRDAPAPLWQGDVCWLRLLVWLATWPAFGRVTLLKNGL